MTDKEFKQLCSTTSEGATLSFNYGDTQVSGKFVGCWQEAFVIDVNGRQLIWPRELCNYRKSSPPIPTYS